MIRIRTKLIAVDDIWKKFNSKIGLIKGNMVFDYDFQFQIRNRNKKKLKKKC